MIYLNDLFFFRIARFGNYDIIVLYLVLIYFFFVCLFLYLLQAVDFNIFEGMVCHGVTEVTISRGKVVYDRRNGVWYSNPIFISNDLNHQSIPVFPFNSMLPVIPERDHPLSKYAKFSKKLTFLTL